MLIVSIPKSGSTSLMETLGKAHKLEYKQLNYRDLNLGGQPIDSNVLPLRQFHGDLSDIDECHLATMADSRTTIYKQHITPSKHNLEILREKKIVVLLRDCSEIVDSYYRGFGKNIHNMPEAFEKNGTPDEWRHFSEQHGLYASLQWWSSNWKSMKNPNWLIIEFNEITREPAQSIKKIENHFQLDFSETKKLVKARYSKSIFTPYRYNRKWRDRASQLKNMIYKIRGKVANPK